MIKSDILVVINRFGVQGSLYEGYSTLALAVTSVDIKKSSNFTERVSSLVFKSKFTIEYLYPASSKRKIIKMYYDKI